jgi:fumarate reductase flavoprotein subunit
MAKKIMNCDLVVLGAGGAGLLAAVKAADLSGKKVIVLEKAKKAGGCTWFCGASPRPGGSSGEQLDSRFRQTMKDLWWRVNPKLIRNALESSGPCFDWFSTICDVSDYYSKEMLEMFKQMGKSTQGSGQQGGQQQGGGSPMMAMMNQERHMNKKSRDPSIGPGKGGSYLVTKMLEQCKKMGIDVLTETRASEFVTDAKGNVTGVIAETNDGKLQVNCKACVIAAGGFGANVEKLKKRWPYHYNGNRIHRFTCPTDEGDTLDMAEKIGVYIDYENMNIQVGGPAHHPYSYTIYRMMWQPEGVYVNLNGERWIDETVELEGGYYALGRQPGGEMWMIVDEDLKELLGTRLYENPRKYSASDADKWILKDFREDIAYEISLDEGGATGKHTKKDDTLDGLAKKIGVDPQIFVGTIETYNKYCDNKRDLDFAKKPEFLIPLRKPPFYAFWGQRFAETTHGGIVINENMEVLRDKEQKITVPGLFAAGDNAGGWVTDVPMPAISPGSWMVSSGYLAGVAAGKYLSKI